jgi:uncharacterized membrane protein HdeD (DUF308 family)
LVNPPPHLVRNPAYLIKCAGILIIVLSVGSALLPMLGLAMGITWVGALVLVAGVIEMIAARVRSESRLVAVLAGLVTSFAGLSLMLNPFAGLMRSATIVTAWLLARSILLAFNAMTANGRARTWLGLAAATDLVLGLCLLTGLSISTLFVTLFGESPQLLAGFGWVIGLSFIATGTMLLEVAGCERGPA